MKENLFKELENVKDEKTFIEFLKLLSTDYDESEWQNHTIAGYFECASEWAEVSKDGTQVYTKSDNPWKRCADILYMGKIYE